jgi:hypothetical protein
LVLADGWMLVMEYDEVCAAGANRRIIHIQGQQI